MYVHDLGGSSGGTGGSDPPPPGKYVSIKILAMTPLEKQLDPLGPIASQGRSVPTSVKYMLG